MSSSCQHPRSHRCTNWTGPETVTQALSVLFLITDFITITLDRVRYVVPKTIPTRLLNCGQHSVVPKALINIFDRGDGKVTELRRARASEKTLGKRCQKDGKELSLVNKKRKQAHTVDCRITRAKVSAACRLQRRAAA